MTREAVVARVMAELAAWGGDQPHEAVTVAEVNDLQQALGDACDMCAEEIENAEDET